ncbi:hypothetical protein TYRP_015709 [Tyrophagus putrescentiae]|nr:hypothetical protein TYRP_015709 [Tyrophagus putrescentiae]
MRKLPSWCEARSTASAVSRSTFGKYQECFRVKLDGSSQKQPLPPVAVEREAANAGGSGSMLEPEVTTAAGSGNGPRPRSPYRFLAIHQTPEQSTISTSSPLRSARSVSSLTGAKWCRAMTRLMESVFIKQKNVIDHSISLPQIEHRRNQQVIAQHKLVHNGEGRPVIGRHVPQRTNDRLSVLHPPPGQVDDQCLGGGNVQKDVLFGDLRHHGRRVVPGRNGEEHRGHKGGRLHPANVQLGGGTTTMSAANDVGNQK